MTLPAGETAPSPRGEAAKLAEANASGSGSKRLCRVSAMSCMGGFLSLMVAHGSAQACLSYHAEERLAPDYPSDLPAGAWTQDRGSYRISGGGRELHQKSHNMSQLVCMHAWGHTQEKLAQSTVARVQEILDDKLIEML